MTTRPYELLARFGAQGQIAGVSVRTLTTVNGREYESDPMPLADSNDPAFTAFAETFAASAVAERDELLQQVSALTQERDTAVLAKEAIETQLARVQAELEALKNPPTPTADFDAFWAGMLQDPAFKRICATPENAAAGMALIYFFGQFSTNQERYAPKIAAIWNAMESVSPINEEEIDRINTLCESTGVPLRLNASGSIG